MLRSHPFPLPDGLLGILSLRPMVAAHLIATSKQRLLLPSGRDPSLVSPPLTHGTQPACLCGLTVWEVLTRQRPRHPATYKHATPLCVHWKWSHSRLSDTGARAHIHAHTHPSSLLHQHQLPIRPQYTLMHLSPSLGQPRGEAVWPCPDMTYSCRQPFSLLPTPILCWWPVS